MRWLASALVIAVTGCFAQQPAPTPGWPRVNFIDVAKQAGLTMVNVFGGEAKPYIIESTGTGVAVFDYDNDGWPDIFLVNGTTLKGFPRGKAPTAHLYHNNKDGTFSDVTQKAGFHETGWGQGVCAADYDNDGWKDLYVTYWGKNRLYHNRGDGSFEEVAERVGVAGNGKEWSSGCAFVDYDRDGFLDLAVANYVQYEQAKVPAPGSRPTCQWKGIAVFCGPRGLPAGRNTLYRNRGNGNFEEAAAAAGISRTSGHYCFSVSTLDFDNDGWPDIYLACDSAPSILYHNQRNGGFHDVGVVSGVAYNEDGREQAGMGTTVADYDGDGNLDIFRTNFSDDTSTLYHNDGNGTFRDVTAAAGLARNTQYLGWGTMFLDFDNDGWPDLVAANGHVYPEVDRLGLGIEYRQPRVVYRNNGSGTFTDVSGMAGPGITTPAAGRGLAIADLWNDGRQSVVVVNMNGTPSLLVNQVKSPNHWVGIRLVGTRSNRDGIGARLLLKTGTRILVDEVRSGSSYISNSDIRPHFGLGTDPKIEYLEVRWPSGLAERFTKVHSDNMVTVQEGSGQRVAEQKSR